ncbi:MAG: Gfo/Idh/MocA family oxidoreductase [Methanotrichaceae archaeon]
MLRVGVIGTGMMGQHHVRVYSELENCELVGVADIDPRGEEIAKKYRIEYYSDYHDLLGKVDAVSIVVPTSLHSQVATEFLDQSVSCLVEKPIASGVVGAKQMIKSAKKNDAKLMVGHIERFNPAITALKKIIDDGILGKLMILTTRRVGPFVTRIRDVGIIVDSATHDIDVARYLIGSDPVDVYARRGKFKHQKEDHAIVVLDFGEITASIEVNWFTPHKVRNLVATGSEGIAYLDYIAQTVAVHTKDWEMTPKIEHEEPLKLELSHFLECVEKGERPLVNGEDGLKVLEIALKATGIGE